MIKIGILLAAMLVGILLFLWGRKKQEKQTVRAILEERKQPEKQKIKIQVKVTELGQINICCMDMEERVLGELLAVYTLKEREQWEMPHHTAHLEHILVKRGHRKRGIGKLMVVYFLRELLRVEKETGEEFRWIYGEIGNGGSDDPKVSLPFYARLDGMAYGKEKILRFERRKQSAIDGLDQFVYYIGER